MIDVTALGEILIDFTPYGISEGGQCLYERNPGGAPANVLACLSKCGKRTAFIGKVGKDMHGAFLKEVLEDNSIITDGLVEDAEVFTTLAFVNLSKAGERSFSFARKPGADTCLSEKEINKQLIFDSRVFHIGSLSLTAEPARSATFTALKMAREAGCIISYDPNFREPLWEKKETAMEQMRSVLPYIDIMKLSDEETFLLTDKNDLKEAGKKLVELGVSIVAVTLGADGALVCTKAGCQMVSGYSAKAVDTTGAGDSFWGGFLYCLLESQKHPQELSLEEVAEFAKFANAVASLCVEKRGAIPAMPTMDEIQERIMNEICK